MSMLPVRWGAQFVLIGGIAALVLLPLSALGVRAGLWHFSAGLLGVLASAILGLLLLVWGLSVLGWAMLGRHETSYPMLLGGITAAGLVTVVVGMQIIGALGVPPIHNISTDLEDPPRFQAVLPQREGANPLEISDETKALQQAGYPWLQPGRLSQPPAEAFDAALATANEFGWEIQRADQASGEIEATKTSFWFGFKDDISIRLRAEQGGTRVDVRSVSRVGRSDLGANAHRIRRYLQALGAR